MSVLSIPAYGAAGFDEQAPILLWRTGSVAYIRFNRPQQLNAIDRRFAASFHEACRRISNESGIRVVCVSGEGRAFAAGGDIKQMREQPHDLPIALIDEMHAALELLAAIEAPVVASVQGPAYGGGLGVMLNCDIVVVADHCRFGLAYSAIGASCDCSTSWWMSHLLGPRRALQFALLGEAFSAAEALQQGLVNWVVPAAELEARTKQVVERLALGPTRSYGAMKRAIRSASHNSFAAQLRIERDEFARCTHTRDFSEGLDAFLAKREPEFQGY